MPSINNNTYVPAGASSYVSPLDLDPRAPASSGGASPMPQPEGEGGTGLQNQQGNAEAKLKRKLDDSVSEGKSQESESSSPRPSQNPSAHSGPPLMGERALRIKKEQLKREKDKKNNVQRQQNDGVQNEWEGNLTGDDLDRLRADWAGLPAQQKEAAENRYNAMIASIDNCSSDAERKTVYENAAQSMQLDIYQRTVASPPRTQQRARGFFGKLMNCFNKYVMMGFTERKFNSEIDKLLSSPSLGAAKPGTQATMHRPMTQEQKLQSRLEGQFKRETDKLLSSLRPETAKPGTQETMHQRPPSKSEDSKDASSSKSEDGKDPSSSKLEDGKEPGKKDPHSAFPSFPGVNNMSKEEVLAQQLVMSEYAMMVQMVLTIMQIETEIVKKGSNAAAGAVG